LFNLGYSGQLEKDYQHEIGGMKLRFLKFKQKNQKWHLVFINYFPIENSELNCWLKEVFGDYNVYAEINLPKAEFDINLTVAKDAAYFTNFKNILHLFEELIPKKPKRPKIPIMMYKRPNSLFAEAKYSNRIAQGNLLYQEHANRISWTIGTFPVPYIPKINNSNIFINTKITKIQLQSAVFCGQVDSRFLCCKTNLANHSELLFMIDQHAAHERILLECYLNQTLGLKFESFVKLHSVDQMTRSLILKLTQLGISINITQHEEVEIKAKTAFKMTSNQLEKLIFQCIEWWKNEKPIDPNSMPSPLYELFKLKSCRNAVKFGDKLTFKKSKDIVTKLSRCFFPFQCSHGRPTCIPIRILSF
jgi:DNA mismatch repair ATPase MutL